MAKKRVIKKAKNAMAKKAKIIRKKAKPRQVIEKQAYVSPKIKEEGQLKQALNELEQQRFIKPTQIKEEENPMKTRLFQRENENAIPLWFYISSIFAVFLFTAYMSIYATIHFGNIEYMNITMVFLFIAMVSFFLISAMFFFSEKEIKHSAASALFFIGIIAVMVYAFKAVDTSNLVKFSIIYSITVVAVSIMFLLVKR